MSPTLRPVLAVCLWLVAPGSAVSGGIKVAAMFDHHMVLQRERSIPVWGWADAGESVAVSYAGQVKSTKADPSGSWMIKLDPMPACADSRELIVTGQSTTLRLADVLVGEVWLAGGQSNMRSPLFAAHNAAETISVAIDGQLRLFTVDLVTAAEPKADLKGAWQVTTPGSVKNFSAVAYFFARELRRTLNCPVGIISAAWGGTPIQTWISLAGLERDPPLTRTLESWNLALAQFRRLKENPEPARVYAAELQRWKKEVEPVFNAATKKYNEDQAAGTALGERPQPAWPEPQNPDPMGMPSPSRRPQTPAVAFNGMIAPLAPYALRGVIWYQGEANGDAGLEYRTLFPRLIQDWRAHWGETFPFLFVQLPGFGPDSSPVAEKGWPWTREAQFMALREPKTGMAITIDVGNPHDVHPADKLDVGHRLARLARRDVYGEKITASGPLLQDFVLDGGRVLVGFRETGSGLAIGQAPWRAKGVEPLPTDRLVGFFVAGADRQWDEADAVIIDANHVAVSSPAVPKPVAVRYGWANSPRCNLYNRDGLPASPFRTDDWPQGAAATRMR